MKTHLVVTPTQETFNRLDDIMTSAPFGLDMKTMFIEIAQTADERLPLWQAQPDVVYDDVKVVHVQLEHVELEHHSLRQLSCTVKSPLLLKRAQETYGNSWVPHEVRWILARDIQPSRTARVFIASLTDILIYREHPFSFTDEMILQVN
jgi:hypothetical protein